MKIDQITITVSRTFNLGNYESLRVEAGITVTLEDNDTPASVRPAILAEARESLLDQYNMFKPKKEAGA